ncbi:MAG: oligosaccharide flippase family protein [Bacteroidales bacterium]|nr:oligosaccharide flippase family protein [Bacteroidales bacterium]
MVNRIKFLLSNYGNIVKNFSYLTLLRLFTILIPLITYPYLIRVLGTEIYGKVIFVQAIVAYASIIIQFGFNNIATKEISIHRNDQNKLNMIVSSVLEIKFFLWLLSLTILLVSIKFISVAENDKWLYLFSFGLCFNEFIFPQWYFQGIEKMGYITIISLIAKLVFLVLIFVVVKTENDYLYVPLFNGLGAFVGGIIALFVVFKREKVQFSLQSFDKLKYFIKESLPIFASNIFVSIKDKFSVIFIGSFLGMESVAIYDLGVKIMNLFLHPVIIVNEAIYPKVTKDKNMTFVIKTIKYTFILTVSAIVALQLSLLPIVKILIGDNLSEAILTVRILLIAPVFFTVSYTLSRNCLIALGYYKYLLNGIILTSLFYLILIGVGYVTNLLSSVQVFAIITSCVFLFEMCYRIIVVIKLKLIHF